MTLRETLPALALPLLLLAISRHAVAQSEQPPESTPPAVPATNEPAEETPPEVPLEFVPYRIAFSLGFAEGAEFPAAWREQIEGDVRRLLARTVGERWSLSPVPSDFQRPRREDELTQLTSARVPVERAAGTTNDSPGFPAETAPDKFLFVTVAAEGSGYRAVAREWDRLSDSLGPLRSETAVDRGGIPHAVVVAMLNAFRPVGRIDSVEEADVRLTLRAGGIPTPDPTVAETATRSLYVPILRRSDREGVLTKVESVPFTFLQPTELIEASLSAVAHSALRSPLGVRRGRVEAWGIAVLPATSTTRLTFTRREDGVPLAGRIVEVRNAPYTPGQPESPAEVSLLTDRSGSVTIGAVENRPLLWITVKSGDATLMRLPLAPGIEPQVTLPLGDDQRRLDTEGRLAILTGELVETVAKRATLLAKARTGARAAKYDEAEAALAEAAKLPDAAEYRRRLAAIETPAAKAAEEAGDRLAAARIRALGRKSAGLIDRYLNADVLRAAREELEELKRADRKP